MDKVVHFEIPFDDKDKCREFYEKVFGWNFQDIPEMNYTIVHTCEVDENQMPKEKGVINGGMYKRDENSSKNPILIIDVKDIDKKLEQIKEEGGTIFREKIQVGDMGLYAQVKDTENNIIGVWQNIKTNSPNTNPKKT